MQWHPARLCELCRIDPTFCDCQGCSGDIRRRRILEERKQTEIMRGRKSCPSERTHRSVLSCCCWQGLFWPSQRCPVMPSDEMCIISCRGGRAVITAAHWQLACVPSSIHRMKRVFFFHQRWSYFQANWDRERSEVRGKFSKIEMYKTTDCAFINTSRK